MSAGKHYATREDFEQERQFCIVYAEISEIKMTIITDRFLRIKEDDNACLRFGSFGRIDTIPLGEINFRACSDTWHSAYVIDYIASKDRAVATAVEFLQTKRAEYIKHLADKIVQFTNLRVEIVHK